MQKTKVTDQDTPIISEKNNRTHHRTKDQYPSWWFERKEQSQLINLADDLSHVIGQDDAVDKIAKGIRRNRVEAWTPNRQLVTSLLVLRVSGKTRTL